MEIDRNVNKVGLQDRIMLESSCPGKADPGAALVKLAQEKGDSSRAFDRASSILLALMGSGMNEKQKIDLHNRPSFFIYNKLMLLFLFLFLFLFLPLTLYPQKKLKKLADSLKYVQEVPYIQNCDDPVLWKIVAQGKDIVPLLIDKMTDTKRLKGNYVPNFGGEYTVADVAYIAIEEIIGGIPTFELVGTKFSDEYGYYPFWWKVRESKKNRRNFRKAVKKWYTQHKDSLVWVERSLSNTGDCIKPNGGNYELNSFTKQRDALYPKKSLVIPPKTIIYRTDQVDSLPQFGTEENDLASYITQHIIKTDSLENNLYRDKVYVTFVVNENGTLGDIHCFSSYWWHDANKRAFQVTHAELERLFAAMPAWKPAIKDGNPVNAYYYVPVSIRKTYPRDTESVAYSIFFDDSKETLDEKKTQKPLKECEFIALPSLKLEAFIDSTFTSKYKELYENHSPAYWGGKKDFDQFFADNFLYPQHDGAAFVGRIVLEINMSFTGIISDVTVKHFVRPAHCEPCPIDDDYNLSHSQRQFYEKELIRIIKKMPRWLPARRNGSFVNSKSTLAFRFNPILDLKWIVF